MILIVLGNITLIVPSHNECYILLTKATYIARKILPEFIHGIIKAINKF